MKQGQNVLLNFSFKCLKLQKKSKKNLSVFSFFYNFCLLDPHGSGFTALIKLLKML